jgi:hypothetical protein
MTDETPGPDPAPEPTPPASVQEIGRQIDAITDKQTLIQVGRRWMRDAHNRGVSRAELQPLIDETFGLRSDR